MNETDLLKNTSNNNAETLLSYKQFLIVGIGASAGGVQALQTFFENVPADSGVAYVIILHMSPDYESQLTNIISSTAKIPVTKITSKVKVERNHIYVVSPNQSLKMDDGHIIVEAVHTIEERRAPIDIFFRTLGESNTDRSVAVVLSGTGADGSMGLKRLKENGGVVFVQNPREAEYADMPRNAIATDLVDEVLNVADIPAKIVSYKNSIGTIEIPVMQEDLEEIQQSALREIFTHLRVRTGHDFSNYKRATVLRRIERRINVRSLNSLSTYATYLRETPEEAQGLLKDLLILVTNFFRDREAFDYIEKQIIPKLINGKRSDESIRIWVAGCATGEEAYSVAMLLMEALDKAKERPSIQIFATDIDEDAIATARDGLYTLNDAADVSPERLLRFFTPEGDGYRVKRELREVILFALHNVLKDPPFSHLDMVTCRNMLIYLNKTAQNRVMEMYHFALNPGGYLFLGSSESVDGANDLYVAENKETQVFQSRQVSSRAIPLPDSSSPTSFRIKMPEGNNADVKKNRTEQETRALERISFGELHQRLLEQYAPPSLVVNEMLDIVHLSDSAARFIKVPGGETTNEVLKLIRQELRLELRTALYQATKKRINIEIKNLQVQTNGHAEVINLHVRPVLRQDDVARGFILIVFETSLDKPVENVIQISSSETEILTKHLEEEIINLNTQLRSANEQFEIQTEELKASNEELQAMNEELRSAAEELETSKEELQSINEELITVNQELKIKIEEISQSNNDFKNLINSADIGTIFLDRNFRVKLFTPAVRAVFNLIQADIGRPLSDITSALEYDELMTDVQSVLQKLQSREREVNTKSGTTFLMQISPYRTAEDRISGVVLVFINITERKKAEEELRKNAEQTRLAVEAGNIGTSDWNYQTGEMRWNDIRFKMHGMEPQNRLMNIREFYSMIHPADQDAIQETITTQIEKFGRHTEKYRVVHPDDSIHWIVETGKVVEWKDNQPLRIIIVLFDVTEQHTSQDILRQSEDRYRAIFNQATAGVCEMDTKGNLLLVNETFCNNIGYTKEELVEGKKNIIELTHPDDVPRNLELLTKCAATKESFTTEKRFIKKDGTAVWITESISCIKNEEGKAKSIVGVGIDINKRKIIEEALQESEERYRIALEAGELATWDWNIITNRLNWNEQHFRLFGIDHPEDAMEPEYFLNFIYPEDLQYVKKQLMAVIGETGVYAAEFRIRRLNDGKLRWMNGYGRVTERVNGKPTRVSGVMYDSTNRREAEENLEAAQNSLTAALEAAKMGVWNMDLVYGFMDRSPKHDQLLGYTSWQEEWSNEKAKQYLINEDKLKYDAAYNQLFTDGIFELEAQVMQPDGSTCWIYYYGRAFENEEGKTEQAAGVIFDITERKTLEKEKDEFIGIASHELKTPVTSIKAYAEILQETFTKANDPVSASMMMKLESQVDRLTKLIKDLLDVTKVSEGQLHLTIESFNIEDLIRSRIEEIQHISRQHNITLTMPPLPPVTGDKERLGQVLTNLLSNAVKYSPAPKEVHVTAQEENGRISIAVQDFGIGMSEGTLARLFERFFRSDNPSVRSYPGLGLGLFISMEIMKRHNGTITVQSEKGKGSTFTMILPLS